MSANFLDLIPEAVGSAGRSTALTASDWAAWAGRSETMLQEAAGGSCSAKLSAAFESYLSQWKPSLQNMAIGANNLGVNAITAAAAIVYADGEGAGILGAHAAPERVQASRLARPITG
jgi:hypothetical protein